jgi:uncharacterized DUF497 family protein
MEIVWTDYLKHRAKLRGFDLATAEQIVRYSSERYFDSATNRLVVIGQHGRQLVMIPYEQVDEMVTPITIHSTTRQQVNLRIRTGRFQS